MTFKLFIKYIFEPTGRILSNVYANECNLYLPFWLNIKPIKYNKSHSVFSNDEKLFLCGRKEGRTKEEIDKTELQNDI